MFLVDVLFLCGVLFRFIIMFMLSVLQFNEPLLRDYVSRISNDFGCEEKEEKQIGFDASTVYC